MKYVHKLGRAYTYTVVTGEISSNLTKYTHKFTPQQGVHLTRRNISHLLFYISANKSQKIHICEYLYLNLYI